MTNQELWRERLREAIEKKGRSLRQVSLSMGRGPGYIHSLLKDEKQPTLANLVAICDELRISVLWLLFGVEMDDDAEELMRVFSSLPENKRKEFLQLVRSFATLSR
jgi:ribonucleoside-diphosphate reductase alpha chain